MNTETIINKLLSNNNAYIELKYKDRWMSDYSKKKCK